MTIPNVLRWMPDFFAPVLGHTRSHPKAGIERGASIRASFRRERHGPQPLPKNMPNRSA